MIREKLSVDDIEELIEFCPELQKLHIYSMKERSVIQTKRATKKAVKAVGHYIARTMTPVVTSMYGNPTVAAGELPSSSTTTMITKSSDPSLERFYRILKTFFQIISSVRPIVWVCDDLQYATKDYRRSSLSFIETILSDSELNRFLFCGIIRDDETTTNEVRVISDWIHHRNRFLVDQQQKQQSVIVEIRLQNMTELIVKDLLVSLLRLDNPQVDELATLIHQRTQGNDYFTLLNSSITCKMKAFSFMSTTTYKWDFDLDEIKKKTMVSDNVLEFVGRRLLRLPLAVQRCLKLAAFIGYRFDEDILGKVIRSSFVEQYQEIKDNELQLSELLEMAVKEGFIERLSYPNVVRYKFVHLEIQQACERLFDDVSDDVHFCRKVRYRQKTSLEHWCSHMARLERK